MQKKQVQPFILVNTAETHDIPRVKGIILDVNLFVVIVSLLKDETQMKINGSVMAINDVDF